MPGAAGLMGSSGIPRLPHQKKPLTRKARTGLLGRPSVASEFLLVRHLLLEAMHLFLIASWLRVHFHVS